MSNEIENNNAEAALEENKLIAERRSKLDKLREDSASNGHPNDFNRENLAGDLQKEFGELDKEALVELDKPIPARTCYASWWPICGY